MNRQYRLQWVATLPLLLLFLFGCQYSAPNSVGDMPTARATGERSDPTPAGDPLTATPTPNFEPGAPGLGDSLYPGFGNGGYDVQHYTLDLTVTDIDSGTLNGTTLIEAEATQDLGSFNLDFIGLTLETVTVNSQPATFNRRGQELTVTPPTPLEAGTPFTVELTYEGIPKQITSVALPVRVGWVIFDGGSFVVSEPDGAANYFPVNDHPLDKATYTFRVTVPQPLEVAANGLLVETVEHGDSTTFVWEARNLMASYLATINISDFDVETEPDPNGVLIRNYYAAGLDEAVRQPFARQAQILALYSELFGPYPFEAYGAVVVDTTIGGALETQTLSIFGTDLINPDNIQSAELVVAHEAAHQWFGNSVSLADWSDIWLNESFATYAEGLWLEHTEGPDALQEWVRNLYHGAVVMREQLPPPGRPPADNLFNWSVYNWGALSLHALRLEVGDEVFFDILRTYYERFQDSNATTADFIAVTGEVSGQDWEPFFDKWLYSGELPPIPALDLTAQ